MTAFGDRSTLAFELRPLAGAPEECDSAAAATWVALQLWVEQKNLAEHTHSPGGRYHDALHWPVIYFVRWLVESWPDFFDTQRWPIPGSWRNARDACNALDRLVAELSVESDDEQNDQLLDVRDAFVRSHSVRAGTGGGLMPDIYFARDGDRVSVAWSTPDDAGDAAFHHHRSEVDLPVGAFLAAVRGLVTWCVERLTAAAAEAARADIERLAAWLEQLDTPNAARAALSGYVGVPSALLDSALAGRAFEEVFELPTDWLEHGSAFDASRSGAAIVFRALSPVLSASEVVAILDRLRQYPAVPRADENIERLRRAMPAVSGVRLDYQVGCKLAIGVRRHIGNPDRFLDIELLLQDWGVVIDALPIADVQTDGGCVWDSHHGPVIMLNPNSARTASEWGRRMVLAHELCHLVYDRRLATRLRVMSGPWTPPTLERRADAFAAELLLPEAGIVKEIGVPTRMPSDVELELLKNVFRVGHTTCVNRLRDLFHVELG
jgi:Zn-dependent peptidase ImmA (M78 family)